MPAPSGRAALLLTLLALTVTTALAVDSRPAALHAAVPHGQAEPGAWPAERVRYDWPVAQPVVLRAFDPPDQPWLPGHRGVDLALAAGEPVRAAADGVVAFAGPVAGRTVVSIDHADGVRTTYEPLAAIVSTGESVQRGAVIGLLSPVERPGHAADSGLHWGARLGSDYLDPLSLVQPVAIRLLE
ncbi:murein hydrolase activator EnvC family protein [Serinibacter salmoneus]|uniref:Peptidase M23-like protein n=1 Tax=Serinibacter salmoneus TaxID=556530 RepID=A0A2A9CY05_9MICO|nr:M23 family metallopeptidase [Serinibacter salmoneus]PFG19318.1 peptidase M23-like protein [Serinibacter salmoneus]